MAIILNGATLWVLILDRVDMIRPIFKPQAPSTLHMRETGKRSQQSG